MAGRLRLQKGGCGQGKEFEHVELHTVFNTRIVTGFCLHGLCFKAKQKQQGRYSKSQEDTNTKTP